jgi:hypothetical protein
MEGLTTFWGDEAQAFSQASVDTIVPTHPHGGVAADLDLEPRP